MMTDVIVGTEIPSLELPPISRYTLALFAGASGDHNPIHIDSDFAKQAGMPVISAAWRMHVRVRVDIIGHARISYVGKS